MQDQKLGGADSEASLNGVGSPAHIDWLDYVAVHTKWLHNHVTTIMVTFFVRSMEDEAT